MKKIRLHFCDFYDGYDLENDFLYTTIAKHFDVELTPDNPDYVICSVFTKREHQIKKIMFPEHFLYPNAIKIMFTGENAVPDLNFCDYAIGFDHLTFGDRYLRFPLFAAYQTYLDLRNPRPKLGSDELRAKGKFCNFTFSNGMAMPIRDAFFHALNARKPVESTGRHLRNSDALAELDKDTSLSREEAKVAFLKDYKFNIAFENTNHPGYTTEKLLEPIVARCLPIYYGNPLVAQDFNPAAFVHANGLGDENAIADEVMRLDENDDAYLDMINADPLPASERGTNSLRHQVESFLCTILDQPKEAARRRPMHGYAYNRYRTFENVARRLRRKPWWRR